jgi:hypothetical protein
MGTLLTQIGSSINQNGSKVATTVEAAAKADREFQTEKAVRSASIKLSTIWRFPAVFVVNPHRVVPLLYLPAAARRALCALVGRVANASINNAVNKPAVNPTADASLWQPFTLNTVTRLIMRHTAVLMLARQ